MDFSSNINTLQDPLQSVSNLRILSPRIHTKPQVHLPQKKHPSRASPTRPHTDAYTGLDIFHLNKPKQEKLLSTIQPPLYNHVYHEELLISEVLNYFKKTHKIIESPKPNLAKFTETGKFFKIRRSEFRSSLVENSRIARKSIDDSQIRCQTANIVRDADSLIPSPRLKDYKVVRRELCPQTKARSPSRHFLHLDALKVKGTNKDFAVRKKEKSPYKGRVGII